MAAQVCVSSATSTVFATRTVLSPAFVPFLTTFVVDDPNSLVTSRLTTTDALGLPVVSTVVSTGAIFTTTVRTSSTITHTLLTTIPVSTLFAPCPTTTTTSSTTTTTTTTTTPTTTTTTTTSRTPSSTTTTTSITPSTITQLTTVTPTSTSSATSSSSTSASPDLNSSSKSHVGAIAGGVVGGVAAIILGAILFWCYFSHSSRHANDRDGGFDFADGDAWDPAAGIAGSGAAMRRKSNKYSNGGYHNSGSTYQKPLKHEYAGGAGYEDIESEKPGNTTNYGDGSRSGPFKKVSPASEQDAYYSSLPRVASPEPILAAPSRSSSNMTDLAAAAAPLASMTGFAAATAAERERGGARTSRMAGDGYPSHKPSSPPEQGIGFDAGMAGIGARRPSVNRKPAPAVDDNNPYGGLEMDGGQVDGGYAITNRMHQQGINRYSRSGPPTQHPNNYNGGGFGHGQPQPPPAAHQQQPHYPPPPAGPPGGVSGLGGQPQGGYHQYPMSIPYNSTANNNDFSSSTQQPLAPPAPSRFDVSSPTPSHRSLPQLGAWYEGGSDEGRRTGRLRVTNEEPREEDEEVDEVDPRFGRMSTGGAYGDLMAGLNPGRRGS